MNTESNGPQAMLEFFCAEGIPILLTRDNSKMQKITTCNEYMRRYWFKYRFIEPQHLEKNPFEQDMASLKEDMAKVMIDYDVDPKILVKVMQHTADVNNHLTIF